MSLGKQITKNFIWLILGEGLKAASGMVLVVILARYLGTSGFGKYILAVSITQIMLILADFGFFTYLINLVAPDKSKVEESVNRILSFKLFLFLIYTLLLVGIIFFLKKDITTNYIICLLGLSTLIETFTQIFYAVFRAQEKMRLEAIFKISSCIINLLLVLTAVILKQSVLVIFLAYTAEKIMSLIITAGYYYLQVKPIALNFQPKVWGKIFHGVWPITLSVFFVVWYFNFNQFLISCYRGDQETAWYGAVFKLYFILIIINAVYFNNIYPLLARLYVSERERLIQLLSGSIKLLTICYLPGIILGITFSKQIILLLLGAEYLPGQNVFIIMLCSFIFLGWNCVYANTLLACEHKKFYVLSLGLSIALNTLINFMFIPRYGIIAAALGILVTEIVFLILTQYFFQQKIGKLNLLKTLVQGVSKAEWSEFKKIFKRHAE